MLINSSSSTQPSALYTSQYGAAMKPKPTESTTPQPPTQSVQAATPDSDGDYDRRVGSKIDLRA